MSCSRCSTLTTCGCPPRSRQVALLQSRRSSGWSSATWRGRRQRDDPAPVTDRPARRSARAGVRADPVPERRDPVLDHDPQHAARVLRSDPGRHPYADWWLTLRAAEVVRGRLHPRAAGALPQQRQSHRRISGGPRGCASTEEAPSSCGRCASLPSTRSLPTISPSSGAACEEPRAACWRRPAPTSWPRPTPTPRGPPRPTRAWRRPTPRWRTEDLAREAMLALRALAWDPFRVGAQGPLRRRHCSRQGGPGRRAPLAGSRMFVAWPTPTSCSPDDMIERYAEAMGGSELITLAIDATRMAPDDAAAMPALIERCGLANRPTSTCSR